MKSLSVSALFVYPIKSCKGIPLDRADVSRTGFQYDRQWMLVDDAGVFVSQRTVPRLATVTIRLEQGRLTASADANGSISIPLAERDGGSRSVRIWNDTVDAQPEDAEAGRWFGAIAGRSLHLVRMGTRFHRPVDPRYGSVGDQVGFADAYPVLVAAESSLDDLNRRLIEPVPMDRFRPNIVLSGSGPYAEDSWKRVRMPNLSLRLVKPCARCVTVTVDQATGEPGNEPLTTLATYRTIGGKTMFGQNAIPDAPGSIALHDPVTPE